MLQALRRYFRTAMRFPKRSLSYLRSMRTSGLVLGIAWLVLAMIWVNPLRTTLLVTVSLGFLLQAVLVNKEIRRRENTVDEPL